MFGCVLENTLENTFYTCCSHFLTFSWLPNEYIISFIPQNTNKTQKKIIKSEQKARSQSGDRDLYRHDRDRRDRDLDRRSRPRLQIAIDAIAIAIEADRDRDRRRSAR